MSTESQVQVLESVVSRLDTNIEKLTELGNSISKLLAVHDSRLASLEKDNDKAEESIKDIHSRISTISREICDKIDSVEGMIETKLAQSAENSTKQHNEIKNDIETKINVLSARVGVLETWRWIIIGGATVIGFLADKAIKLFTN
jgi:chromosome segregation ATPase